MRITTPHATTGVSKVDIACSCIREMILSGDLPPGSRLVLRQLATQLNVSDIPVREALQRLQAEGLVTTAAHVGAVVADLSRFDLLQNLVLRADIESLAAGLAALYATPELIVELERLVGEMDRCLSDGDLRQYAALNKRFHLCLSERCPLPNVRSLSHDLWEVGQRTRILFQDMGATAVSNQEHRQMIEALRCGDAWRIRTLVRQQKWRSIKRLIDKLSGDELIRASSLVKLFPDMLGVSTEVSVQER